MLVEVDLDGTGHTDVETGVPFYDHMLAQLGKHGGFDLTVRTKGDLEIDAHHTVEDTAIALGEAFRQALGDKAGLRRFGDALVPLDEALAQVAVDLSGRPYLVHDGAGRNAADDRPAVRDDADPARLRVLRAQRPASRCTCGCSAGGTRTTSSRRSSRRWRGRCATPPRRPQGQRHPVHQGRAVSRATERRRSARERAQRRWAGAPDACARGGPSDGRAAVSRSSSWTTGRGTCARPSGRWPGSART